MNLTIWFSNFSASCFPFLKNWQWTFTPDNCNCTPRPPCSVAEQTAWHCGNCASIAIVINSFLCLCFFLEISTTLSAWCSVSSLLLAVEGRYLEWGVLLCFVLRTHISQDRVFKFLFLLFISWLLLLLWIIRQLDVYINVKMFQRFWVKSWILQGWFCLCLGPQCWHQGISRVLLHCGGPTDTYKLISLLQWYPP